MNLIVKFTYENGSCTIYTDGNPKIKSNHSKEQIKKSAEKAIKDIFAHLRKHKIAFKMEVLFA